MNVIIGKGGHARVCWEALSASDPDWVNDFVFCNTDEIPLIEPHDLGNHCVVIGIGDLKVRRALFDHYGDAILGVHHPFAAHASDVQMGHGGQYMAGSIIQPGCKIGNNVLINTRASIDHDCIIGDHVHIAPGAILCGGVTVGEGAFIGAGAVITPGRTIGPNAFIKAGSVV